MTDLAEEKGVAVLSTALPMFSACGRLYQNGIREVGFGAGMGLPNIKRHADQLRIETSQGHGTTVHIVVRFK